MAKLNSLKLYLGDFPRMTIYAILEELVAEFGMEKIISALKEINPAYFELNKT